MKKIKFPRKPFANIAKTILLFLASYSIYTGCIKKTADEEIDIKLEVSEPALSFSYTGGEQKTFNIMTNYNWTVEKEAGATWLHFESATSGSINDGNNQNVKITVKADPNPETALRTATITVSNDIPVVENKTISVTQAGLIPSLTITPKSLNFSSAKYESKAFKISSNYPCVFKIEYNGDDNGWLKTDHPETGEYKDQDITVTTIKENDKTIQRTASIIVTIKGQSKSETIVVTQDAAQPQIFLDVAPKSLEFDAEGDDASITKTFKIQSNVSWTISKDKNWLTIRPTSGSNDRTVEVYVERYNDTEIPRTATITITPLPGSSIAPKYIDVTQNPKTTVVVDP